jgi:RimJ/RimL family protein N-acetyltransferase
MPWTVTRSLDEFLATAGDQLRADPVIHTVPLTVLESLRQHGPSAFGDDAPVYGWHEPAGAQVDGAFFQTPPHPILTVSLPAGSAADLIKRLGAEVGLPTAINLPAADEADFARAWASATGGSTAAALRSRLFRLDRLTQPYPTPPGAARVAGPADRELLIDWHVAFSQEAGTVAENAERTVDDRLSHGGLRLWEADGRPVSMAGNTRAVAGVVRIAPVYTVPADRGRGYGGAVTAAASQAALDAGASAVVLFTDLANPTSNALYQRLGYRPVGDRVVLQLTPGASAAPDVPAPDVPESTVTAPDVTGQATTAS